MATSNKESQKLNHNINSNNQRQQQQQQQHRRNRGGGHHHHRSHHAHNKRPHASSSNHAQPWSHSYEDDEVDDLVVAAQYAFALPTPILQPPSTTLVVHESKQQHPNSANSHQFATVDGTDENEIDLDDGCLVVDRTETFPKFESYASVNDIGAKTEVDVGGTTNQNDGNIAQDEVVYNARADDEDDDDDDDDAESEIDLLEELAHMVGEEDDQDEEDDDDCYEHETNKSQPTIKIRNKPMTVNEIDAYQADLHDIHNLLQSNVTISETIGSSTLLSTTPTATTINPITGNNPSPALQDYHIAGLIQHHMVDERTIVILSFPGGILLKEGTALVIHRKDLVPTTTVPSMDTNNSHTGDIIPLGIILEIFGPVGQPLYSVRLPLPSLKEKKLSTMDTTESKLTTVVGVAEVVAQDTKEVVNKTPDHETERCHMKASFIVESAEPVEDTSTTQENVDPWCRTGEYTKMLQLFSKLPVYYWNDPISTNVLDTAAVIRNSGRGCDASNLFDEEIIDVQDYSDDEQERAAKGNRNKKNYGTDGTTGSSDVPQNREQRSTIHRNRGKPTNHPLPSVRHPNHSRFAVVPGSYMQTPPPQLLGFHPTHATTPALVVPVGGIGVPYYPTYPTTQYYATPYPPGVPLNPSYFVPSQPPGFNMPSPAQLQQPWYYYNGAYQSVPPPPPPPPPRAPSSNSMQPPPSSQGDLNHTVYYDIS